MSSSIVRKCLREAIAHAEDGDRHHCITLEARRDDTLWVQLTWEYLNLSYPSDDEPAAVLARHGIALPSGVTLERWEPKKFATFEHPAEPENAIAEFVEEYFEKVLHLVPSEFTLKMERESLRA